MKTEFKKYKMSIQNLAKKLLYPVKQSSKYIYGAIPFPVRYGKVFRETYGFLQESQWWSKKELEEYQMQQLELLLNHAYENVIYYRRIFNERGLKPKDIRCVSDLKKLPYLTKDDVRNNFSDLVAKNYPKSKLCYFTTGGSTGIPLGFYLENGITLPKEWAFVWRQWNWAEHKFGQKRITLRGDDIINRFKNGKRQWWEYDPVNNALTLSSYDMTDENLPKYIEKIKKFKPVVIRGIPSSLFILASFLKETKQKIFGIKSILTSSENLYPYQREIIEEFLGAKIYDLYGNTERNALIMQCGKGNYHIIPEYGILELIGKNNESIDKEDNIREIIATGFNNYAMPFIRYKTDDLALCCNKVCSCGRNYSLIERIEGRVQEFIVTKDGSLISLGSAIIGIHDIEWTKVKQIQFIQEKKGHLIIQINKNLSFSEKEVKKYVLDLFKVRFGGYFKLNVRFVDNIPRTKSGKHRFLIQKLPVES